MATITTISEDSIRRLVKRLSDLEAKVAALSGPGSAANAIESGPPMYFATADAAITAKSGGTWGTGTANLTVFDTGTEDFRETGMAQTVRNRHEAAFADDEIVRITHDASGDWFVDPLPYKALVRFTLDADMTETDASVAATITDQFGIGSDEPDTSITVHNLLVTGSTYGFDMLSGDAGYALRDTSGVYRVIAHAVEVTGKVRVSADDDLAYLEEQEGWLTDQGTYAGGEDLAIAAETVDVSGDELLLKFVDASTIPATDGSGHTTGKYALIIDDSLWKFMLIEPCDA